MTKFAKIYNAALNSDEMTLISLKGILAFNDKGMSPITQLAYENQHEAVELLIKHRFPISGALKGYAMNSNHIKAQELLRRRGDVLFLLVGYAMAGKHDKVDEYFMHGFKISEIWSDSIKKRQRLNYIAMAYAQTEQHDKVEEYLKLGASITYVAFGYARAGNKEKVKKYLELGADKFSITDAFISIGRDKIIDTYCREELKISRYQIAALYANNHNFGKAKEMLIVALLDEIKVLRESIFALFVQKRMTNLTTLMQVLTMSPTDYSTVKELFTKYQLEDLLWEAKQEDGLKKSFEKLLWDPNFLHLADETEIKVTKKLENDENSFESLAIDESGSELEDETKDGLKENYDYEDESEEVRLLSEEKTGLRRRFKNH